MKIAFVFDGLGIGGIERVGIDIIRLVQKLGHKVDVCNINPSQSEMKRFLPEGVRYFEKKFMHSGCPELYSYGVKKWWWGKFAYPILHVPLSAALGIRKLFRTNQYYDVAIAFSGHINDLTFVAKNLIRSGRKICWCHGSLAYYVLLHDGYPILYKKMDKIVTLSDLLQYETLYCNKFLKRAEVVKIYNPCFIEAQACDEKNVAALKSRYGDFVLMCARFTEQKDYKTAIEAASVLKSKGYENKFVFVGDGPLKKEMELYANGLGVGTQCVFEGARSNMLEYYRASHLFLLCSKIEGLSTVLIEAMTEGKPCVFTECDAGEVSDGGKYISICRVGDPEDVANKLIELLSDSETYRRYSELSRTRAKDFDPDKISGMLEKLLC